MIDVKIDEFKNLLSLAGAFTSEATFNVKGDRLELMVIDDAHVAMAKGSIALNSTPEVDCFTVDVEKVLKALATTGSDVKISVGEGILALRGDKSRANISLVGSVGKPLREPQFEATASAKIQPSRLKSVLDFGAYSKTDYVKIMIAEGKMSISAGLYPNVAIVDGDEVGEGDAVAGFMADYVATAVKLANTAKSDLTIKLMGDDRPALFEWQGETSNYSVLVAPRIES